MHTPRLARNSQRSEEGCTSTGTRTLAGRQRTRTRIAIFNFSVWVVCSLNLHGPNGINFSYDIKLTTRFPLRRREDVTGHAAI